MPALKKKKKLRLYTDKKARKKHVETMFLTTKQKKFAYYFKDRNLTKKIQNNKNLFFPRRFFYTIKILQSGYLTLDPLKAIMRLYKWFLKTQKIEQGLKLILRSFPDFVLTSKPKEMRMGKGKGAPAKKVAMVKKGAILLSLENRGISAYLTKRLILMLTKRVPLKHKVIKNFW